MLTNITTTISMPSCYCYVPFSKNHILEKHINIRAALIHVLGDFLQSVGVLVSSGLIKIFGDSCKVRQKSFKRKKKSHQNDEEPNATDANSRLLVVFLGDQEDLKKSLKLMTLSNAIYIYF